MFSNMAMEVNFQRFFYSIVTAYPTFSVSPKHPPVPRAFLHRLAAEEATLKRRGCLHSWAASLPEARLHNPAPEAWGPGKGSSPHMLGLKGEGTATPSPTEALLLPGLGSSSGRLKCHPWQVLGDILTSCRDGKTQKLKRTNSQIFFTNNLSDNKIKGKIQLDLAKVF